MSEYTQVRLDEETILKYVTGKRSGEQLWLAVVSALGGIADYEAYTYQRRRFLKALRSYEHETTTKQEVRKVRTAKLYAMRKKEESVRIKVRAKAKVTGGTTQDKHSRLGLIMKEGKLQQATPRELKIMKRDALLQRTRANVNARAVAQQGTYIT